MWLFMARTYPFWHVLSHAVKGSGNGLNVPRNAIEKERKSET